MIITIAGVPGSGKDSVAEMLLRRLREQNPFYELLSMGNLRREAARKNAMTIEEFNIWSERHPKEGDKVFDEEIKRYAKEHPTLIIVSRLAWHLIPKNVKVYLDVDPREGARRIHAHKRGKNRRNEHHTHTVEEQQEHNRKRIASDQKRYGRLYGVDPYDHKQYDLAIDTTRKSVEEVTDAIIRHLAQKG